MKFADSFRAARWVRLVNLLLQAVLFLTLFGGLNYIALNHTSRFDLSAGHRFSLSAETRSYLDRLERDVEIFVTFSKDDDSVEIANAGRDIDGLLREYVYATRGKTGGRVTVRFVDVYAQRKTADELGLDLPNAVVVACENRRRNVTIQDLYTIRKKTEREAFRGEAAVTAAILDVSNPDRKKIYFVQGHGEFGPDNVGANGLSTVADELRQRNFDLGSIDLSLSRKIPDDAALLIVAGPQRRFEPYEEELLRSYLGTRAGRVLMFLPPGIERFGLDNLLIFDWGIVVHDNILFDPNPQSITETGDLRLWNDLPNHPVTQNLISNVLAVVVGQTRAVTEDLGRSAEDGLDVKTLIATSADAWGEASYRLRVTPQYTPGQDLRGQLGVLVASERVRPAQKIDFSVRGGRIAVMGNADVIANNRIFSQGNLNLFLGLVNWAVDRDTQVGIPARPIERFQLTLSREELARLRLGLLLIVPGAVGLVGLLVYLTRRN